MREVANTSPGRHERGLGGVFALICTWSKTLDFVSGTVIHQTSNLPRAARSYVVFEYP